MPKIALGLESAKARDADILTTLGKVQHAAQNQRQQTKINLQRLEWTEQSKKFALDVRHLENDLQDAIVELNLVAELALDRQEDNEAAVSTSDMWFQVAGVRRLFAQIKQRDPNRLRQAPDQAASLHEVAKSVSAAVGSLGRHAAEDAVEMDRACRSARSCLRKDLLREGVVWSVADRSERYDLSDEEETLLERAADDSYEAELLALNGSVSAEMAQLERELSEARGRLSGWGEDAHFRFVCIRRQFQGQGRDLLFDRLLLEFPHLTREQLQVHEGNTDAVKFASQRVTAAFRQWRKERMSLLKRAHSQLEERRKADEALASRRQDLHDSRERKKELHARLQKERARVSVKRQERHQVEEAEQQRQQAAEQEKAQTQRRRAESVKTLQQQHAERRREEEAQREEEAAQQALEEEQERARRMERNSEVVRLRNQMDDLKKREKAQVRFAKEQENREREERLKRAMQVLKVESERDPDRLLRQPSKAFAEAYSDPLICVTRGPHAGFDEKRLMADARYKLSAALQAAGLFSTKAGHEALARAPAPRAAVPHEISSVFATE